MKFENKSSNQKVVNQMTIIVLVGILTVIGCGGKKKQAALWPLALIGGANASSDASGGTSSGSTTGGTDSGTTTGTSAVATPTFSLASGHYSTPQSVSMLTSLAGGIIRCTTDGTEPTNSSSQYSEPIHIWSVAGATLKCRTFKDGVAVGETASAIYSYPPLKTGQTTSYATGDDGATQLGVARSYIGPTQHSTYINDYTTTDNSTGLVWKTCSQGLSDAACGTGGVITMNWQDAQTGVNGCNTLNSANTGNGYAGRKTWRLPSKVELESIVDYTGFNVDINPDFFPHISANNYWTSSSLANDSTSAWFIGFRGGIARPYLPKNNLISALCVSGHRKVETENFTDNADGVVQDNTTGLFWQKCASEVPGIECEGTPDTARNFSYLLNYCNGLSLAGKTWRLPNVKELSSIVNTEKFPGMPIRFFPNPIGSNLRTSTTMNRMIFASESPAAMTVDDSSGQIYDTPKRYNGFTHCVSGP